MKTPYRILVSSVLAAAATLVSTLSSAAPPGGLQPTPPIGGPSTAVGVPSAPASRDAEKVDVDSIKEKYWARGEESEIGVVQNRAYSKAKKFELGVFLGSIATDPFLAVNSWGGTFGYHFDEYISIHGLAFKHMVRSSEALLTFENKGAGTTNYNPPRYYLGGEVSGSLLYGKLSLIGKAIIYYDFHVLAGLGVTQTESNETLRTGPYLTPHFGVGQQVYLSKAFSLRVDYRAMVYTETLVEKVIITRIGQPAGERQNWSHSITVGIDFLFGFGGGDSSKLGYGRGGSRR